MTNEALQKKINLVMDKLIHLGGADYENDKNISLKDAIASGNVARDFGIEEWDWPQGVGLYGLSMLQDYYRDDRVPTLSAVFRPATSIRPART